MYNYRFTVQSATKYLQDAGFDTSGMNDASILAKAETVREDVIRLLKMSSKKARNKS